MEAAPKSAEGNEAWGRNYRNSCGAAEAGTAQTADQRALAGPTSGRRLAVKRRMTS